jgi:hypothetical protein
MTDNQNRQPEGIPTGGQYAATPHSDQVPSLATPSGPPTAADIVAEGTQPVTLKFVDYDHELNQDQISMILEGRWNDAENDVDENFSDAAYEEAIRIAEEEINAAHAAGTFDREWDDLDEDEKDEARYAVEARDDSDPVKDLLRNTPSQLMRTSLGQPTARLPESRFSSGHHQDDGGFEARQKVISDLLEESGMDTSSNAVQETLQELVNNGPWDWHEGVQLDVIFYGDIADAVPNTRFDNDPDAGKAKVLEFSKPHILLIDKWNGSGHDVVVPAPLKRTLTVPDEGTETPQTGRVYLDDKAGGYSWDDVCGLVKSAYADGGPAASWEPAKVLEPAV